MNVIASAIEIFKGFDDFYSACDELQRRLHFLYELGIAKFTPQGAILLTDKGNSYFKQQS